MSIALMTEAWKTDLPAGRKMVLLALCDNANDQGECYPSIKMTAEKCSMGERTVQAHIAELEREGLVVREVRTGRSTIYRINPERFKRRSQVSHYVYKIEDVDSGEFYIGVRTCNGPAETDGYMGSGAWFNERISHGRALRKTVVSQFGCREEAMATERSMIIEMIGNPLCRNQKTPAESAPRRICTPQISHPTPAESAPQPPQISHPTPAESAPITINEPSIEPSRNQKNKREPSFNAWPAMPDKQVLADWYAMRKRLKADVSQTVLNTFGKELALAQAMGFSVDECLSECVTRNWRGFRAEWMANARASGGNGGRASTHGGFEKLDYSAGINPDGSF